MCLPFCTWLSNCLSPETKYHPDFLEMNLDELLEEISILQHSKPLTVGASKWLKVTVPKVDDILKELKVIRSYFFFSNFKARLDLNKKVILLLTDLETFNLDLLYESKDNEESKDDEESLKSDLSAIYDDIVSEMKDAYESKNWHMKEFSRANIMKFTSKLKKKIGSGGYGDVYKGYIPRGTKIAVKVLKDNGMDVRENQTISEVITHTLIHHQNLVKLYGYCVDTEMSVFVYEYANNGSFDKILYENHLNLQWGMLYSIVIGIAKGLSYLHENGVKQITHHDIKAANVLIDSKLSPKITDFGLSRVRYLGKDHGKLTEFRGTRGYAAPELWMGSSKVTHRCDIFSFGMMLFEVLQRKRISEGQEWFPEKVWKNFENGTLDKIIMDCGIGEMYKARAKTLCIVALWCIQYIPTDRPSMSTVVKILEGKIKPKSPTNPFPYKGLIDASGMSSGSASTWRPPSVPASSIVFSTFDECLHEGRFLD